MSELHFHIEIYAPKGLVGIEQYIPHCRMMLEPWKSGFNGKVILRSRANEERFEWSMDSSENDVLTASGYFYLSAEESKELMGSLSYVLAMSNFRHRWGIDDESGSMKYQGQFKWDATV